jgi:glycosyltransferase involved in cell wall biosynthesis
VTRASYGVRGVCRRVRTIINLLQCHREYTGTGRYVKNLISELALLDRSNHYVLVLSEDNYGAYAIEQENFTCVRAPLDIRHRGRRIAFEQTVLPFLLRRFATRDCVLWSPNDVPIAAWGHKQIVTMHDLRRLVLPEQFAMSERIYYRTMMRLSVWLADHIFTVSQVSKRDIAAHYGYPLDRITVTYNAVDPDLRGTEGERQMSPQDLGLGPSYLLFVGSQLLVKSPHVIVQAFNLIAQHYSDLELVLVGKSGNATPLIMQAKRDSRFSNRIHLLPWLSDVELRAVLAGATMFVFPTRYEGFGIPPLEAMALGTPVITSRESCMPEICGDAAYYLREITAPAVASAIEALLEDHELRASLVRRGHLNIARFSWRNSAAIVHSVLNSIAA